MACLSFIKLADKHDARQLHMSFEQPEILYQDDFFIAVNKPAGLAVHRSPMTRDQKRFLVPVVRDMIGKRVYPVHRLDRPTGGVILLAFSSEATRLMAENFGAQAVRKTYLAVVRGYTAAADVIDYPLTKSTDDLGRRKERRSAVTRYRRLATAELPHPVGRYPTARYSLVEARPVTGRQHQIRRHMNHISHPILGDRKYGDNQHNRFFNQRYNCRRLLLAATELQFVHPYSQTPVRIRARIDPVFSQVLQDLGWQEQPV
jgi:tRNA pseudouridine65 synthase